MFLPMRRSRKRPQGVARGTRTSPMAATKTTWTAGARAIRRTTTGRVTKTAPKMTKGPRGGRRWKRILTTTAAAAGGRQGATRITRMWMTRAPMAIESGATTLWRSTRCTAGGTGCGRSSGGATSRRCGWWTTSRQTLGRPSTPKTEGPSFWPSRFKSRRSTTRRRRWTRSSCCGASSTTPRRAQPLARHVGQANATRKVRTATAAPSRIRSSTRARTGSTCAWSSRCSAPTS
mmetsp:Transcript_39804/g.89146  ORF Transcript_39804/g.89146 Transcript_39804/m.89146 type:complete len:233 (-) Transcript_39804:655-1353(-)